MFLQQAVELSITEEEKSALHPSSSWVILGSGCRELVEGCAGDSASLRAPERCAEATPRPPRFSNFNQLLK